MIEIIEKDITTVTKGIICHQVNCMGAMKSGVALALRNKFNIYSDYKKYCEQYEGVDRWKLLGEVHISHINDDLKIANLFAQYGYGGPGRETEYKALSHCLQYVDNIIYDDYGYVMKPTIYIPYKMSSDRGGADWNIVLEIIKDNLDEYDVKICKLPNLK